jgi:hypothetical protein
MAVNVLLFRRRMEVTDSEKNTLAYSNTYLIVAINVLQSRPGLFFLKVAKWISEIKIAAWPQKKFVLTQEINIA